MIRSKKVSKKPITIKHQLHLACDDFGGLREQMGFIEFNNGFVWATDAHIALKISTAEIFQTTPEIAQKLDGKRVSRDMWKMIKGKRVELTEDGIILFSPHVKITPCVEVPTKNIEDSVSLKDKIEMVLPKQDAFKNIPEIAINSGMLSRLCKAMNTTHNYAHMKFVAPNKGIVVLDTNPEVNSGNIGIVMPVMITSY